MNLSAAAGALRASAETLGAAGHRMGALDLDLRAFGATGPGRLGDLGHDLHLLWRGAVDARVAEASAHAARLYEAAEALGRAGGEYAGTDEAARRGQTEVA